MRSQTRAIWGSRIGRSAAPDCSRTATSRLWVSVALAAVALFLSCWRIVASHTLAALGVDVGGHLNLDSWYNYSVLLSNYFTDGVIRRGIGGSIFYLLRGMDQQGRIYAFHLISAAWLVVPLGGVLLLLSRSMQRRAWVWFALVLLFSPHLFLAWSRDIARTDMMAAGFVAWAMLASLERRYLLAAVVIFAGGQVHEVAVIYGVPLMVGTSYLNYRSGASRPIEVARAVALLGLLLVIMAVSEQLLGAPPYEVAAHMLRQSPDRLASEMPVYFTVGGLRTVAASVCQAWLRPHYHLFFVTVFLVFPFYAVILPAGSRLRLGLFAFVGLLPLLFMMMVAVDYGRWLSLAVLNWWLMNAALELKGADPLVIRRYPPVASLAAAMLMLMLGPGELNNPNKVTWLIADRLWGEIPMVTVLDRCDATWRTVLYPPTLPRP